MISLILLVAVAAAGAGATPLFEDAAALDIRLAGPIRTLLRNKRDKEEFPFTLRADGIDHSIEVRARGNSRMRVCRFPLMRLDFASGTTADTVFEGQETVKLVTHCKKDERAEQDLLQEYLAYRIFNLLSDVSYRVRLLRIEYVDTDDDIRAADRYRYAFAIESTEELARRTGAEEADLASVTRSSLDPEQAALVFIFQFLIGNTDWSVVKAEGDAFCCHNIKLIAVDSRPLLLPYDFDLSGIVNAPYAKPDGSLPISRVTKRLYRGYCVTRDPLESALHRINGLRADIMALPDAVPGLSDKNRVSTSRYLAQFFDKAQEEQKLLDYFEARCL